MRILAAIDSFKGSLSSVQAGNAVRDAVNKLNLCADVQVCPLADGGEGTVDAFASISGFEMMSVCVTGPLGLPVTATYCMRGDVAILEMAQAAGLTLIPAEKRNPMKTTTFGVGEMIRHAIQNGCRRFVVGIGGSATNDGGAGMLQALGFRLLDVNRQEIPFGCEGLGQLCTIVGSDVISELKECSFRVACDVTNPLCGANGCSGVFGLQKGATPETVAIMDQWMSNYATVANNCGFTADADCPGAGAAGGLGFAFLAFTNATLESGIRIVLDETGLEEKIIRADFVITGEGRLDGQSVMGKAPIGVAELAKQHGKRVIAFCGCTGQGVEACLTHGIDAYYVITPAGMDAETAMRPEVAYRNFVDTATRVLAQYK